MSHPTRALRFSRLLFVPAIALSACSVGFMPDDAAPRAGVSLPDYHYDVDAVETWEGEVGHRADVVQTFVSWEYAGEKDLNKFPAGRVREIAKGGRTVEVTWVPEEPSSGDDQPRFDLAGIADGDHDRYVKAFAEDIADSGAKVRIRLAHEMNGSWQSFNESNGDNEKGDFVKAWRHVHDVVEDAVAGSKADVTWVWSPNVVTPKTTRLEGLYPGDDYVDIVGIDGYSYPRAGCRGPEELFAETLTEVRGLSDRPVEIAEVGVATACPNRERWVRDLMTFVERNDVQGVTWWEREATQGDFRLVGDDDALGALRKGIAD